MLVLGGGSSSSRRLFFGVVPRFDHFVRTLDGRDELPMLGIQHNGSRLELLDVLDDIQKNRELIGLEGNVGFG